MALIECSECGQMVSDKASTCPHCGAPVEKKSDTSVATENGNKVKKSKKNEPVVISIIAIVVIAIFIWLIVKCASSGNVFSEQDVGPVAVEEPEEPVAVEEPEEPVAVEEPEEPVAVEEPEEPVAVEEPVIAERPKVSYDQYSDELVKAAQAGDAEAQSGLGDCYYHGDGVKRDIAEAVKWYTKSAKQGNAKAQYDLGSCYYHGDGVTKDKAMAVKWYRKAADQGYAQAQYILGVRYRDGDGVTQNYAEAVKWYRKAADQGDFFAQYELGNCYKYGDGVTQNYAEAVKWYRKAADQGLRPAYCELEDLEHELQEHIKQSLETLNNMCPQEVGLGMIIEKALLDGDYVVYVYRCDENLISIDQLNSNKQNNKSLLKDTNSNMKKYDSDFSTFLEVCKAAKKGLEYRYIGNSSGKTCIIRIPCSEL